MKVYVSGKISGESLKDVRFYFEAAKARLMKKGYDVITPFENGLPPSAPYAEHMKADIRMLLGCDAIFMLPGWGYSPGARVEHEVARACGLRVYTEADMIERGVGDDD